MTPQNPKEHPIVEPKKTFEPIELGDAAFPSAPRTVIHDPLRRFILDRFKTMTSRQAAEFLAGIDIEILEQDRSSAHRPRLQFTLMTEKLGLASVGDITLARATDFYLDFCPYDQQLWIERLLESENTTQMVKEKTYDFLATQLPAIGYTLAHIFEGGYIGLLTARGDRANHARQIQRINETIAFSPQLELIYYVNDEDLSKRLGPTGKQSAEKKAIVLMNFINGFKENEHRNWVPMSLGKPFDEIIFIDDEDKNLKAVMECLIRDVYSNVLRAIGMTHRTASIEQRISERARETTEATFSTQRLKPLQEFRFWLAVVDNLLPEFTERTGKFGDREALIQGLMERGEWLPDKLKVYDGNAIPFEDTRKRLDAVFQSGKPLELGSKKSIVFNDIDGNLVTVPAKFYVHRRSDPDATPLLEFNQAQFAQDPNIDNWLNRVAQEHTIDIGDLNFSLAHFRDPEFIERDILKAAHKGKITQANPRSKDQH